MNVKSTLSFSAAAAIAVGAAMPTFGAVDTVSLLAGGTHTYSNNTTGTVFTLSAVQPVGSGVFDPYVRIDGKHTGVEEGYNSFDDNTLDNHPIGPGDYLLPLNSGLLSSDHHIVLLLDSNESGSANKSDIILTDLILVVSTNPNKSGTGGALAQFPVPLDVGDVLLYHMNTTTDLTSTNQFFQILIDANDRLGTGNGGSGQADLEVSVDVSGIDLTGLIDSNHYLYAYSSFVNFDAGYEEWRTSFFQDGDFGGGVPEPASLGLLGVGAAALVLRRRRA